MLLPSKPRLLQIREHRRSETICEKWKRALQKSLPSPSVRKAKLKVWKAFKFVVPWKSTELTRLQWAVPILTRQNILGPLWAMTRFYGETQYRAKSASGHSRLNGPARATVQCPLYSR